ncbi:tetraspanin-8-like [Syngnathoides biaculeatus]|uniref:tetraspanin-8-like n=1 Tax=Syngnathoides biaculeatus TaxID=300417 RepID=UPI002ADE0E3C|nr:tetraspanin-8-like [Syngnathoides biaculeatus]
MCPNNGARQKRGPEGSRPLRLPIGGGRGGGVAGGIRWSRIGEPFSTGTSCEHSDIIMAVNKCIKYLLFFFNLLFWLSGCVILGVAIYLKVNKDGNSITDESLPGIDLLIAVGVIIMALGFLGCCGAIKENRCMLILFFASLLLIFILLLAAGILGAVGEKKVKEWVKERLQKLTPLSGQPENVRDDLDKLQKELKCCGLVNGASDWDVVPDSCRCGPGEPDCGDANLYTT